MRATKEKTPTKLRLTKRDMRVIFLLIPVFVFTVLLSMETAFSKRASYYDGDVQTLKRNSLEIVQHHPAEKITIPYIKSTEFIEDGELVAAGDLTSGACVRIRFHSSLFFDEYAEKIEWNKEPRN